MGRDAWKKTLEVLAVEIAIIAGDALLFYSLMHPARFKTGTGLIKLVPDWGVALCGLVIVLVALMNLPDTISYCSAALGVPFFETGFGRWCARWIAKTASTSRTPTSSFYFLVAKEFEHVRLSADGVVYGGDFKMRFGYNKVYKAFFSRRYGTLVLRIKRNGGPTDVIAGLSGLSKEQVDELRDLLDERLPKSARRYGFGPLSSPHTFGRAYDPWDCWFAQKKWGGEFRQRWRNWHIPPDTPRFSRKTKRGHLAPSTGRARKNGHSTTRASRGCPSGASCGSTAPT